MKRSGWSQLLITVYVAKKTRSTYLGHLLWTPNKSLTKLDFFLSEKIATSFSENVNCYCYQKYNHRVFQLCVVVFFRLLNQTTTLACGLNKIMQLIQEARSVALKKISQCTALVWWGLTAAAAHCTSFPHLQNHYSALHSHFFSQNIGIQLEPDHLNKQSLWIDIDIIFAHKYLACQKLCVNQRRSSWLRLFPHSGVLVHLEG